MLFAGRSTKSTVKTNQRADASRFTIGQENSSEPTVPPVPKMLSRSSVPGLSCTIHSEQQDVGSQHSQSSRSIAGRAKGTLSAGPRAQTAGDGGAVVGLDQHPITCLVICARHTGAPRDRDKTRAANHQVDVDGGEMHARVYRWI